MSWWLAEPNRIQVFPTITLLPRMVSFFKKKPLATANTLKINNIANPNTESLEEGEQELQLLASKFSKLPFIQACDTISAHEKHTLPLAKQLFAAYDGNDKPKGGIGGNGDSGEEMRLGGGKESPTSGVEEPLLSTKETSPTFAVAPTASIPNGLIAQESAQTLLSVPTTAPESSMTAASVVEKAPDASLLNDPSPPRLLQTNQQINTSNNSSISLLNVDADMIISPVAPDAVFLSAIPKEFAAAASSMEPLPLKKTVSFQETVTMHSHADFQARLDEIRKQKMEEKGVGVFGKFVYGIKRMFSSCGSSRSRD